MRNGILTYNIDDDDISKDQKTVIQYAIEEWDKKVGLLNLEELSGKKKSDITIEFQDVDDEDEATEGEDEIAGQTMTLFDDYGFIGKSEIIINKNVQGYEFDTKTIGQIAKHEMDHALGLRHANFDGSVANSVRIPFGSGAFIDPLVEPSYDSTFAPINSGQPYLVPGQKIDMAIVKFNPSEQSKPIDDPLSLANNEIIATEGSVLFCPFSVIGTHCLQKGDHVVAYYVANSLKESDTFFRHGIYVLDTATRLGNAIPD